MPKVVIQKLSPISFGSTPFLVYDHDVFEGEYYFKYRANITINDTQEALQNSFEIRITRESPYVNRPNMFKNVSLGSSKEFVDAISGYDDKRIKTFKKKVQIVKKVSIMYQDMLRGFVEFTMKNTGTQEMFATITQVDKNVPLSGQVIPFNSDPLIRLYAVPRSDFIIGDATVFRNKTRIAITPKDKRIAKFNIRVTNFVDNLRVPNSNSKIINAIVGNDGVARIDLEDTGDFKKSIKITPVSFYKNINSTAYRDKILNKNLIYNNQLILFPLENNGASVNFQVLSISENVIGVRLLRKNITKRDRKFVPVDQKALQATQIVLADSNKQAYDTYLYKIELEFKDGTRVQSSASYTLHPKLLDTSLNFNVNEVIKDDDDLDTVKKFEAVIEYNNTTTTQALLNDLKTLGIDNIFPNEIKNLSTQLDPITAVLVTKINLMSGIEEQVGVFKPGVIKIDHRENTPSVFLFEAIIKSAAETIEDIASSRDFYTTANGKNVGDPLTSARALGQTSFSKRENFTQKFFNKSALYYGTLKYGKTLATSQVGVDSGRTGNIRSISASPVFNAPKINFVSVSERLDDKIVTWNATNLQYVENFSIYDSTSSSNLNLIARSVADNNRLDFTIPIPKNVSKITIVADMSDGSSVSIEANT